jgi:hypothetical protein
LFFNSSTEDSRAKCATSEALLDPPEKGLETDTYYSENRLRGAFSSIVFASNRHEFLGRRGYPGWPAFTTDVIYSNELVRYFFKMILNLHIHSIINGKLRIP